MKKLIFTLISIFALCLSASAQQGEIPLPTNAQLQWHNMERIMFVHWGMATWQGREYDNHSTPLDSIHPSQYSTDQWCEVARSWGATMIIFVAKHVGGFCWWQTNTTDYGVKQLKWRNGKADVMADLSASCKKYGLRLGVYVYPGDDKWGAGIGSGGICRDTSKQEEYNKIFRQQLTEVLSNYGTISEVWFDGNCKIPVKDILEKYAKDAVVFQSAQASLRWVGNEDGIAPYPNWYTVSKKDLKKGDATALNSDIDGDAYAPIEIDVPLLNNGGHKWFWAAGTDSLLMTTEQLMTLYYKSVGRGGNLLLNSTPDTSGIIPLSHQKVYAAFGKELNNRFMFPIRWQKGEYRSIFMDLNGAKTINHVVIQEDLTYGQRILEYRVKGKIGKDWVTLCKGTSVGSKRIEYFNDITVEAVKLEILKSKDSPHIKYFMVYNVQTELTDLILENGDWKPIQVGYWNKGTFSSIKDSTFVIDLSDKITEVGQYLLSFDQLSYDYNSKKSSALIFKNLNLEIYGSSHPELIQKAADNQFLIINSQQTQKDFPIRFKADIRSSGASSIGEITIKKVTY